MNKDTVEGNLTQFKGKIKQTWGKFTDNQLSVMEGKADEVIGKLQELYGYSRERAEKEWKRFEEKEGTCSTSKKNDSCCSH